MNRFAVALVVGSMLLVACGASDPDADQTAAAVDSPWRVLVDDHQNGGSFEPVIRIATDPDGFDELWALLGRDGDRPSIEFDDENPYLVMVGIDRDALSHSSYELTTSVGGQVAALDL